MIYDTNMRTAYAAGRWKQLQDTKQLRPYWQYRHSHASEDPRPHHMAWDKLVLDADDAWWHTHYPPNGWGCKCYVASLSPRDMKKLGKKGPDKAPAMNYVTARAGARGNVRVPRGIDAGFAYAPGRIEGGGPVDTTLETAVQHRIGQVGRRPRLAKSTGGNIRRRIEQSVGATLAAGALEMLGRPENMAALKRGFVQWRNNSAVPGAFGLGVIPAVVQRALKRDFGVTLANAVIWITRKGENHATIGKVEHQRISEEDFNRLPEIIRSPDRLLIHAAPQTERHRGNLVFVFSPADPKNEKKGKAVVRVNTRVKTGRDTGWRPTNEFITSAYVEAHHLEGDEYVEIDLGGRN